ncbi:hypothetical protein ES319_D12G103700v1 [Gossypium barbadense]|uniref:Uncharacterized protein n=1 Tax=Gossypium barbadense TaxID=3634 RepID=A0A5J5NWC0_GOSBA|nr:hypothetical protein ES319_D12G103700v1 [Gossypium barbadense]
MMISRSVDVMNGVFFSPFYQEFKLQFSRNLSRDFRDMDI